MNDDKNDDNIDLNGESRAKRLFVSIEPLPDRRVYRIDPRGIETYDEEPAAEERLKFLAQLIHEPERPEVDSSRQAIEKGMGTAIEQFTRLKNISNRLATPDSEFTVSPVDAPPPDPLEFENVVMAAYQGRKNQLRASSELLSGVLAKLKQTVQHQRTFHEDFQTLRRSRWKMYSPDSNWRPDVWHEPLNAIVKHMTNTYCVLDVFRMSDGKLSTIFSHQLTGRLVHVEAHDLQRQAKLPYYATGICSEIDDLYRPLSNTYIARSTEDIHRLWLWITKRYDDYNMLWMPLRKSAQAEGLEMRDEEILVQMPNSPVVFTLRTLKPKHTVPKPKAKLVDAKPPAHDSAMDVDTQNSLSSPHDASEAPQGNSKKRKYLLREYMDQRRADSMQLSDEARFEPTFENIADQESFDLVSNMVSDFDISVTQDLLLLCLKQTTLIMLHGQSLDQVRFPLFPLRRASPMHHPCFAPVIASCHHFRQLVELSRLLDDFAFTLPRTTLVGPLLVHFEPTGLSTTATLHLSFGTLNKQYTIQKGKFVVSPLQELDTPTEFLQHIIHVLANYLIQAAQDQINALCGNQTATKIHSRAVSFPLGVTHPLGALPNPHASTQRPKPALSTTFDALFEIPVSSPLSLTPSLIINPHFQGAPVTSSKWPLGRNIWQDIPGNNFAEKLASLVLIAPTC